MRSNLVRRLFEIFFSRTQNEQGQNTAGNEPHGNMDGFLRDGIGDAGVGEPGTDCAKNQGKHWIKRYLEGAHSVSIRLP